jgi:hypothetical protein
MDWRAVLFIFLVAIPAIQPHNDITSELTIVAGMGTFQAVPFR